MTGAEGPRACTRLRAARRTLPAPEAVSLAGWSCFPSFREALIIFLKDTTTL